MSVIVATIAVTGSVQFWDRHCEAGARCGLPSALSEKMPVAGSVREPEGPGKLSLYRVPLTSGERSVDFQVFWVAPPDGSAPYLVTQARLTEAGRLVSECTQYADEKPVYFPVGMCSGFVPDAGGTRQIGVTFYK